MSPSPTTQQTRPSTDAGPTATSPEPALRTLPLSLGVLRIALGLVLGWSFLDKLFGFGFPTPGERAVLAGSSATRGYLMSIDGFAAGLFQAMAGHWWVDALFLLGLGGGAIALLFGIASRLGTVAVIAVMGMLWLSSLPLSNNPVIDQHLFYCLTAVALLATGADRVLGLGTVWRALPVVRKQPVLW